MKKSAKPAHSSLFFACALFCLGASPAALAVTANEAPPGVFTEDSFGGSVSGEYFTTKANYETTRGAYTRLPGDSNLSQLDTKLRGRYTASKKVSFFLGTTYTRTNAVDLINTKTNSQLSEALAGVDYLINTRHMQLVPELILSFPLDQTNVNQLTPMTNDGAVDVKAGVFALKPYRQFRLGGYLGAQWPVDSLAKRLLYEATIDWRIFTSFTIGGGIDGYETLMGDSSALLDRQAAAVRANAGSERFYSYNPALVEARGWVGYRPDNTLWLRAGMAKTLNGLHTAEGQSFLVSLVYNSAHIDFTREPVKKKRFDPDEAAKTFEIDSEATDQSVFEPEEEEIQNTNRGNNLDSTEKLLEKKSK